MALQLQFDSTSTAVTDVTSLTGYTISSGYLTDKKKEEVITGCTLLGDEKVLAIGYIGEDGSVKSWRKILPDIVNVERPNTDTVFVEFGDGTKEVAHVSDDDTFNMETGVLICVTKKLFSLRPEIKVSGSSAYNKIMKYAMTKVDASRKKREAEQKAVKEGKARVAAIKEAARKKNYDLRENRINEIAEAVKRALNDISQQASDEIIDSLKLLADKLDEAEREDNEQTVPTEE